MEKSTKSVISTGKGEDSHVQFITALDSMQLQFTVKLSGNSYDGCNVSLFGIPLNRFMELKKLMPKTLYSIQHQVSSLYQH